MMLLAYAAAAATPALAQIGPVLHAVWTAPGVSEFVAAIIGGGITMLAQGQALRHDRRKDEERRRNEAKALAWQIFFKIHHIFEVFNDLCRDLALARVQAAEAGMELWQAFQCRPHDWDRVTCEAQERIFRIRRKS